MTFTESRVIFNFLQKWGNFGHEQKYQKCNECVFLKDSEYTLPINGKKCIKANLENLTCRPARGVRSVAGEIYDLWIFIAVVDICHNTMWRAFVFDMKICTYKSF